MQATPDAMPSCRTVEVLGEKISYKTVGAETGGSYSVFEVESPPGTGTPPHVHHREEEAFYILEGEYEFVVDGTPIIKRTGDFLRAPRDIPHHYRNSGDGIARMLLVVTPSGFEHFFDELCQLPAGPPDIEFMRGLLEKYGMELLI